MFETPNSDYNAETQKWDWEPGIFFKRDANRDRICFRDVDLEGLTDTQEYQNLLDVFVQALVLPYLLNEFHFDIPQDDLEARVVELAPMRGPKDLAALRELMSR